MMFGENVVYLSRRNLLALLAKLDANKEQPGSSACSIVKYQNPRHDAPFRQTIDEVMIVAIDDEAFYCGQERAAGEMKNEENLPKPSTGVEPSSFMFFDSFVVDEEGDCV